jgi:hypothetical protein
MKSRIIGYFYYLNFTRNSSSTGMVLIPIILCNGMSYWAKYPGHCCQESCLLSLPLPAAMVQMHSADKTTQQMQSSDKTKNNYLLKRSKQRNDAQTMLIYVQFLHILSLHINIIFLFNTSNSQFFS